MPFLLRATPRPDLAEWSLRSKANLTAAGHSRDTPDQTLDATEHPPRRCPTSSIRALCARDNRHAFDRLTVGYGDVSLSHASLLYGCWRVRTLVTRPSLLGWLACGGRRTRCVVSL